MNLLQFSFIISGIIILILALDVARRKKFNALHFIIFILVGMGLLVFTFFPTILTKLGNIFGLQRGADLLVYASIIFLFYFVILLLNKIEKQSEDMTKLIREIAIAHSSKKEIHGEIVFVIAAYNEEKVITDTLDNLIKHKYLNIIVVNDGSVDNTLGKLDPYKDKITILTHYKNRGQGASLETGFEYLRRYGKTQYICTFDADGQHQIKDLNTFIDVLKNDNNIDIVLGSRFIKKSHSNISLSRIIILKLGILFTFFVSKIKLSDTHNGYRVFRSEILDKLYISIDGMGHASELIDIIAQKNISFKEVPVDIIYTDYSKSKGQSSMNAFNIAGKMIWNKFFK